MVEAEKIIISFKAHFKVVAVFLILAAVVFVIMNRSDYVPLKEDSSFISDSSSPFSNNSSPVNGVECTVDEDCRDGNQCTFNLCDEGKCVDSINIWGECVLENGEMGTCNEQGECVSMESYCDNGVDDDGNGLTDCEEEECEGLPCTLNGKIGVCQDGLCVPF